MSDKITVKAQEMLGEPVSSNPVIGIKVELQVILKSSVLGGKKESERINVPPGSVFVLSYDFASQDAGGFPEVYLAGEEVSKEELRDKAECRAVELKEFPGKGEFEVETALAAISRTSEDPAAITASYRIRLHDPLLFLRFAGGEWQANQTLTEPNRKVSEDLKQHLEGILRQSGLQLWSGDERNVFEKIRRQLDEYLMRIGLRIDPEVYILRQYPQDLYEIALQFGRSEQVIRYENEAGHLKALAEQIGLSERELVNVCASPERLGVGFFQSLIQTPQSEKERIALWLKNKGVTKAASFVERLYATEDSGPKYSDQDIKLSEQVILAAIRNPMLTIGEWLREGSEVAVPTRFQRLQSRIAVS
ncbi:MAG TPA: hypothetical protein ENN36_00850 [Candidatus Bathyarchaeota archaeon]|nr:hypothetical protein [Candidatus Bathyarchaeota archaeon]